MAAGFVNLSGVGGLRALDLQKILAGKIASARPYAFLSSHGISGSAAPAQLETALQLLYQTFTAPGNDDEAFALLKRQLEAMLANRGRAPGQIFGEKLAQVNTSDHYTARPLTPERLNTLDRDKMLDFYRRRFSNAADFTFFMVGAFKVDDLLPLLAQYVGALPTTGQSSSHHRDVGLHFPESAQRVRVEAGREPRGQTVISFFADPPADPTEQENVSEATTVLETTLRDILREENLEAMTARVLQEVRRLQDEGPTADLTNRAKESARRGYEVALRQNDYWLRRLESVHTLNRDPGEILTRTNRIDAVTRETLQEMFRKYFPADRSTVVTLVPAAAAP